jgi:hypothetical protein
MHRQIFSIAVLFSVAALGAAGADPLPEPVPVGSRVGHSLCETIVHGPDAGKEQSLICALAGRPAVLIYAREIDPALISLLKKLDAVVQSDNEQKMKSACVLLTTKDEDREQLQAVARREKLEATLLAATPYEEGKRYFAASSRRCSLHKEAMVTVVVLQRLTVQSSYAFRKGELTDGNVDEVVRAASALLPAAKQ